MKDFEASAYLDRIHLNDTDKTYETLSIAQQRHIESVPFENLNIIVKRPIRLDAASLFDKIVVKKRGGYCFELNLLYAELLKVLGFLPQPVLGRVWLRNPKETPPRNHLAHIVEIDGEQFVTDVGFGGLTTRVPLNINHTEAVDDSDGKVRIISIGANEFMLQRLTDEGWVNQYSFETVSISREDIVISNYFMSTHPRSHFFMDRFVGKFTEEGRIGLYNNQMSIRVGTKVVDKKHIPYGEDWISTMEQDFNLGIDFSDQETNMLFA